MDVSTWTQWSEVTYLCSSIQVLPALQDREVAWEWKETQVSNAAASGVAEETEM